MIAPGFWRSWRGVLILAVLALAVAVTLLLILSAPGPLESTGHFG